MNTDYCPSTYRTTTVDPTVTFPVSPAQALDLLTADGDMAGATVNGYKFHRLLDFASALRIFKQGLTAKVPLDVARTAGGSFWLSDDIKALLADAVAAYDEAHKPPFEPKVGDFVQVREDTIAGMEYRGRYGKVMYGPPNYDYVRVALGDTEFPFKADELRPA